MDLDRILGLQSFDLGKILDMDPAFLKVCMLRLLCAHFGRHLARAVVYPRGCLLAFPGTWQLSAMCVARCCPLTVMLMWCLQVEEEHSHSHEPHGHDHKHDDCKQCADGDHVSLPVCSRQLLAVPSFRLAAALPHGAEALNRMQPALAVTTHIHTNKSPLQEHHHHHEHEHEHKHDHAHDHEEGCEKCEAGDKEHHHHHSHKHDTRVSSVGIECEGG